MGINPGVGGIKLPKKIKGKEGENTKSLMVESFTFSYKFFSQGIKSYISSFWNIKSNLQSEGVLKNLADKIDVIQDQTYHFSKLYKDTCTISKFYDPSFTEKVGNLTLLKNREELGRSILRILSGTDFSTSGNILIMGPIGSYKNRLLQYVYLSVISKNYKDGNYCPVFYLNFANYEKDRSDSISEDIEFITKIICEKDSDINPILILDNVRTFRCGVNLKYGEFKKIVDKCRVVVGADNNFSKNNHNRCDNRSEISFLLDSKSDLYSNVISLSSLDLFRKEESIAFIENCLSLFKDELRNCIDNLKDRTYDGDKLFTRDKFNCKAIWKFLVQKQFSTIDVYQLKQVLLSVSEIVDETNCSLDEITLRDIYGKWAERSGLADYQNKVSEYAYNYEYGQIDNDELLSAFLCGLREHRSLLEYFIAEYYGEILCNNFKNVDFKMPVREVFPKGITRFFDGNEKIYGDSTIDYIQNYCDSIELSIKQKNKELNPNMSSITVKVYIEKHDGIDEDYFNQLELEYQAKIGILSMFAFILGRMPKDSVKNAIGILRHIKENIKSIYKYKKELENKSKIIFLERSVNISLIYQNQFEYLKEYITEIINNEIVDDVNRGYHLDYYGDILKNNNTVIPNIEDTKLTKGINTFRALSLEIERHLDKCYKFDDTDDVKNSFCKLVLELVTYCKLMEKRNYSEGLAQSGKEFPVEFKDFVKQLFGLLTRFLYLVSSRDYLSDMINDKIINYFKKVENELNKRGIQNEVDKYNKPLSLGEIKRLGWEYRQIIYSENVAAHSYNCWIIGYMLLPEEININDYQYEYFDYREYNKNLILELLLIHDIGERSIGDIRRGRKKLEDKENERNSVETFLKDTTLPKEHQENILALWIDMEKGMDDNTKNINACIAKEIDYIQGTYQYFVYFVNNELKFNDKHDKIFCDVSNSDALQTEINIESDIQEWLNEVSNDKIKTNLGRNIRDRLIFNNIKFIYDKRLNYYFKKFKNNLCRK